MAFSLPHAQGLTGLLRSSVRDPKLLSFSEPIFDPRGHYQIQPAIGASGQWLYGIYYGRKGLGQLTLRMSSDGRKEHVQRIEYWGQFPNYDQTIFDWFGRDAVWGGSGSVHLIATDSHGDTYEEGQRMSYYTHAYRATKGLRAAIRGGVLPGVVLDVPSMHPNRQGTALYRIDTNDLPFADNERLHPLALMGRLKALQKQQRCDARSREKNNRKTRNRELLRYLV